MPRPSRRSIGLTAVASVLVLLALSSTTATAHAAASAKKKAGTLSSTPVLPFQIAFRGDTLHFSDGFAGTVTKVTPSGEKVVASAPGGIDAVEFSEDGKTMAFTSNGPNGSLLNLRR